MGKGPMSSAREGAGSPSMIRRIHKNADEISDAADAGGVTDLSTFIYITTGAFTTSG